MLSAARTNVVAARRAALRLLAVRSMSSSPPHPSESFMQGANSVYVEHMWSLWLEDPKSVHSSWDAYFRNVDAGLDPEHGAFTPPPSIQAGVKVTPPTLAAGGTSDSLGLAYLIRAYQTHGHRAAEIDPLNLHQFRPEGRPAELDIETHGFSESDLDRPMQLGSRSDGGQRGFLEALATGNSMTLRQVRDKLEETYCGTLGVEYTHITSTERCNWIRDRIEHPTWQQLSADKKMHIYERVCFSETFESFLGNKFNTTKRFGLDGGEAIIPGLKAMIDHGSELGIDSFVFGMPHRGRLNVLANVLRKPMPQIFKEFQGTHYVMEEHMKGDDWSSSGDVKYHLGTSMDRTYPDGRRIHLSLLANPSHLEPVAALVIGKARAKQFYSGNRPEDTKACMPVVLHGDAAFAGQGICYEIMQCMALENYSTGGTIHAIVNNQVGFTTDPSDSRSTVYCSDLGKAFDCPIFHCNGDDPISVVAAFELATEYRHQWGHDCVIDMICYRRNGHNELDQPLFTQPALYQKIHKHPGVMSAFAQRLISNGVCDQEEIDEINEFVLAEYERDYEASKTYAGEEQWIASKWQGYKGPRQKSRIQTTGVDKDLLRDVGLKISTLPDDLTPHRQIKKIIEGRKKTIENNAGIDWGTAEHLAFATLLLEGNHVRVSGQDVQRGTFSHRHAVIHDQKDGHRHIPLNYLAKHLSPSAPLAELARPDTQAEFVASNSPLSEFAVLGFELGYSLENPNALVIWEAQFGDFANTAQVIYDQFISSGEDKWLRQSGLVTLLPHGYDGQGAEHSSCRLERFLQMCDDDPDIVPEMDDEERMQIQHANWQVANITTPANYFHLLRRQIHRDFRKPLIVAAPKNLLRHRMCVSSLEDMATGTSFTRVFPETDENVVANADSVRKVVFLTGQLYYELLLERQERELDDVAIVRVEQIAPFPFDRVAEQAALYPNAEIVWAQHEPKNMGCWTYVQPRIETSLRDINSDSRRASVVARPCSASPATGMSKVHAAEHKAILEACFS